jgi:DNA-directed RNA polymerase subunit RPC12/RpoP
MEGERVMSNATTENAIPHFSGLWEHAFKKAEETLGFKPLTKKQLGEAGYQTGKNLPKPCCSFGYKDGLLYAYNPNEATPKNTMSDAQKAAIEKAKHMAQKVVLSCTTCGRDVALITRKKAESEAYQNYTCSICDDRVEASEWAKAVLANPEQYVVLDTETTDLDGEIIEIAVVDLLGNVLMNQRIKPLGKISAGAQAVHGISLDMLAGEPYFYDVYPRIKEVIKDKIVLIYNRAFDKARLAGDCRLHNLEGLKFKSECVMLQYAQFVGDWSDYWESYRWQPLNGGHSALSDCKEVVAVLREMAAKNKSDADVEEIK